MGGERGCSRGHASKGERRVLVPGYRLEVPENKRGYFVLALRCVLVQIFHHISSISVFLALLAWNEYRSRGSSPFFLSFFLSDYDCFYGGVISY